MTALPSLTGRISSTFPSDAADELAKQALRQADDALEEARFSTAKYKVWNVLLFDWEDNEEYTDLVMAAGEARDEYDWFVENDTESPDFAERERLLTVIEDADKAFDVFTAENKFVGSQTKYGWGNDNEPDEIEEDGPFYVSRVGPDMQALWVGTDANFDALAYQVAVTGEDHESISMRMSYFQATDRKIRLPDWFKERVEHYKKQLQEGETHE